jgi:hypothetical protein
MVIGRLSTSVSTVTRYRALSHPGPKSRRVGCGPCPCVVSAATAAAAMSTGATGTSRASGNAMITFPSARIDADHSAASLFMNIPGRSTARESPRTALNTASSRWWPAAMTEPGQDPTKSEDNSTVIGIPASAMSAPMRAKSCSRSPGGRFRKIPSAPGNTDRNASASRTSAGHGVTPGGPDREWRDTARTRRPARIKPSTTWRPTWPVAPTTAISWGFCLGGTKISMTINLWLC